MKVELIVGRSLGLYIDGVEHNGEWSCGEEDSEEYLGWTTHEVDGSPLKMGELLITNVRLNVSSDEFAEDVDPTEVHIFTVDPNSKTGTSIYRAKVQKVEDNEDADKIKLVGGQLREVDEHNIYILAEAEVLGF